MAGFEVTPYGGSNGRAFSFRGYSVCPRQGSAVLTS
jgi:hypothetical protein